MTYPIIGFFIFCIAFAFIMERMPSWVYGLLLNFFEKIMD